MRRRLIVIACLVPALLIAGALYKKWKPSSDRPSSDNLGSKAGNSSLPPFPTKEPKTYRATRVVTVTQSSSNTADSSAQERTNRVSLARDGEQRREEYEVGSLGTIVYLETKAGRFVLLPQARLYGSPADAESDGLSELTAESETMSPDFLLHESTVSSEYQRLGEEVRSGRMTTKYRVLTRSGNSAITSETLIWVDETLGMPIASQFVTNNVNGSTRVLMELNDVSTEVEPGVFALPADYRKVAVSEILNMVRAASEAARSPAAK